MAIKEVHRVPNILILLPQAVLWGVEAPAERLSTARGRLTTLCKGSSQGGSKGGWLSSECGGLNMTTLQVGGGPTTPYTQDISKEAHREPILRIAILAEL